MRVVVAGWLAGYCAGNPAPPLAYPADESGEIVQVHGLEKSLESGVEFSLKVPRAQRLRRITAKQSKAKQSNSSNSSNTHSHEQARTRRHRRRQKTERGAQDIVLLLAVAYFSARNFRKISQCRWLSVFLSYSSQCLCVLFFLIL